MRWLAWVVGLLAVVGSAGCYSHEPIQKLNQSNLEYLERLEIKLSLLPDEIDEYKALPEEEKPIFLEERKQANLEDLRELFADPSALKSRTAAAVAAALKKFDVAGNVLPDQRPAELNAELAALQERYYVEMDAVKRRAVIVDALEDMIRALKALRLSAGEIHEYLDMSTFSRMFTEAKALDRERLKKITDDLKVVGERLKPLVLPK